MMKKLYLVCLLVSAIGFSQTAEEIAEKKRKIEAEKAQHRQQAHSCGKQPCGAGSAAQGALISKG